MIKEAQAQGIMKTTIENAIKNSNQATDIEAVYEVRGPGRVALMVELMGKNKGQIETTLHTIMNKNGGIKEKGIANMFEKKGWCDISCGGLVLNWSTDFDFYETTLYYWYAVFGFALTSENSIKQIFGIKSCRLFIP